jgi:hypothetical protein
MMIEAFASHAFDQQHGEIACGTREIIPAVRRVQGKETIQLRAPLGPGNLTISRWTAHTALCVYEP